MAEYCAGLGWPREPGGLLLKPGKRQTAHPSLRWSRSGGVGDVSFWGRSCRGYTAKAVFPLIPLPRWRNRWICLSLENLCAWLGSPQGYMRVMDPFLKDNPGAKRCSTAHFKEHAPDRIQPVFFLNTPPQITPLLGFGKVWFLAKCLMRSFRSAVTSFCSSWKRLCPSSSAWLTSRCRKQE